MKKALFLIFLYSFVFLINTVPIFRSYNPLPKSIKQRIINVSWKPDGPIALDDLAYLEISFWGYDDQEHIGELIVHKALAQEVLEIFKEIYEKKFPIERMRLIDDYNADDIASMNANNSSALCVREITNKPGIFSNHSYGIAIDINTKTNPYIKGNYVLPEGGKQFLNRDLVTKGIIIADENNACYMAFKKRGWDWGGAWYSTKGYVDYQHFSKKIEDLPYIY